MESTTMMSLTAAALAALEVAVEAAFPGISKFPGTFQSGPIWLREWSDMASKVGRYDFMDYHIRPLWKPYQTTLENSGKST